jgi:hypothetical protein
LTASLYRRISHVLKPPDVLIRGVTTFLKPGASALSLELAGKIVTVLDCGIEDLLEVIEG